LDLKTLLEATIAAYDTSKDIYVLLSGDALTTQSAAAFDVAEFPEADRPDVILFADGLYVAEAILSLPTDLEGFEQELQQIADEVDELERAKRIKNDD